MQIESTLFRRLDLTDAVTRELSSRNRLLPRRWDYAALATDPSAVESWLRPQLRRGPSGNTASVVFADKGWRGVRPLHVMSLADRVLYRALVTLISESLPASLRSRIPAEDFRQAPLEVPTARYISKTDVTSYYEFVDHELLRAELINQTGEEIAADALIDLLQAILARRVGLPQVHPSSDVLGDTYIDPARRRLIRQGHPAFTYSDDFRITSDSLGRARAALEACATEVRSLGLVLNERKTYTYRASKYRKSLTSFTDAERRLFGDEKSASSADSLGFFSDNYSDAGDGAGEPLQLGALPLDSSVDEDEVIGTDADEVPEASDPARILAAQRAWELWLDEDESDDVQAGQDAAITQSLVGRALPTLGAAADDGPLEALSQLLRLEPALTPHIATYIDAYAQTGSHARVAIREKLDEIVSSDILSPWQGMWLADIAGAIRRARRTHDYETWLVNCVKGPHDGLAATAAAALGRIGREDPDAVAEAIDRVSPEWRRLAFWGLIGLDRSAAESVADDELDRLMLTALARQ